MKFIKMLPFLAGFAVGSAEATVACNGFGQCGTTAGVIGGVMGNFDIANDTGQDAYGFEIDYENADTAQVGYTWDWSRYGAPTVGSYTDIAGVKHAVVHYEAKSNGAGGYQQRTIPAPAGWSTGGHSCTSSTTDTGCEHFVTGMYAGPGSATKVEFYWLVAGSNGLVRGTGLGQSAPGATMAPPQLIAPPPVQQPIQPVQVVVQPIQPAPAEKVEPAPGQWGEPVWLKVTKTKTHGKKIGNNAGDVVNVLVDEDKNNDGVVDWVNGQPAEVEAEWYLIQRPPVAGQGGLKEQHVGKDEVVINDETITRQYEWFDNIAPAETYDVQTHEQMCDKVGVQNPDGTYNGAGIVGVTQFDPAIGDTFTAQVDCSTVPVLGKFLASNMVAFEDVMPLTQLEKIADIEVNTPMEKRTTVFGGNAPYQVTTTGDFPAGLSIDPATGMVSGTPTQEGAHTFDINVTDTGGKTSTKTYTVQVLLNGQVVVPATATPVPTAVPTAIPTPLPTATPTPVPVAAVPCAGVNETYVGLTQIRNLALASITTNLSNVRYGSAVFGGSIPFTNPLPVGTLVSYQGVKDATGVFCVASTITLDPAPVVATATPVPTIAPTATPIPTVAPTATPIPTIAPTATPVPTATPTPVPATSCVAPTGAKSWNDVHNRLKAISGDTLTIGSKQVVTLPCTTIQWKGTAKALVVGYDVDANKGYILNGVNYATNLIVDNGK